MTLNVKVQWTGRYPCLCFGEWIVAINGVVVPLPENKRKCEMNTRKEYESVDMLTEEVEYYWDGMRERRWIRLNRDWLLEAVKKVITVNPEEELQLLKDLYRGFREQDWRHGSCGGCI